MELIENGSRINNKYIKYDQIKKLKSIKINYLFNYYYMGIIKNKL